MDVHVESAIEEVVVMGDRAHAWTQLHLRVTLPDARPVVRAGPAPTIFRRRDGRWPLFRDANMLADQAPLR